MPITYCIDRVARLVRARVSGIVSAHEMLTCVSEAADAAGEPGYHIVSDHREIAEAATRAQVERVVDRLHELRPIFGGARWAVVVARPASFGMMRMLGVLAEEVPMTVRVFQDAAEAERWARSGDEPPPGALAPPSA